jgi:predicted nucleic acid-binding protein
MRVLIDTNILLDVFFQREPHVQASAHIWQVCEGGGCAGFVTPLTPVNIYYIAQKRIGMKKARELVRETLNIFQIAPLGMAELENAFNLSIQDYEDAVQIAGALSAGVDAIVTRNGDDFAGAPVPIYSPDEFLKTFR